MVEGREARSAGSAETGGVAGDPRRVGRLGRVKPTLPRVTLWRAAQAGQRAAGEKAHERRSSKEFHRGRGENPGGDENPGGHRVPVSLNRAAGTTDPYPDQGPGVAPALGANGRRARPDERKGRLAAGERPWRVEPQRRYRHETRPGGVWRRKALGG